MEEIAHSQLINTFIKAAELNAATVERIAADKVALNEALVNATDDDEFVLLSEPDDLDPGLFSIFRDNEKVITRPEKQHLKTVRTGITDAFGGVAASGSVCVTVSKNFSSALSMLTRRHIVVMDANTIVSRPADVLSKEYLGGKGLDRSFSFISGTSATADMGSLVRGVHGPGQLHIILLEKAK